MYLQASRRAAEKWGQTHLSEAIFIASYDNFSICDNKASGTAKIELSGHCPVVRVISTGKIDDNHFD